MAPTPAQHVTTDPHSRTHRLVLRCPGLRAVELSITGAAPERLRYQGQYWIAAVPAVEGTPDDRFYAYHPE